MSKYIDDFSKIQLCNTPYQWAYHEKILKDPYAKKLLETFPTEGYELRHTHRQDKSYMMYHRTIYDNRNSPTIYTNEMNEEWVGFITELLSPEYISQLSRYLNHNLHSYHIELNFWQYKNGGWLSPHTDKHAKVVSQLFYFNEDWDPNWGGGFRVLRSDDIKDCYSEIFPGNGNSIILIRSDNSWHAVTEQKSPDHIVRKVLQLIFWKYTENEMLEDY